MIDMQITDRTRYYTAPAGREKEKRKLNKDRKEEEWRKERGWEGLAPKKACYIRQ